MPFIVHPSSRAWPSEYSVNSAFKIGVGLMAASATRSTFRRHSWVTKAFVALLITTLSGNGAWAAGQSSLDRQDNWASVVTAAHGTKLYLKLNDGTRIEGRPVGRVMADSYGPSPAIRCGSAWTCTAPYAPTSGPRNDRRDGVRGFVHSRQGGKLPMGRVYAMAAWYFSRSDGS